MLRIGADTPGDIVARSTADGATVFLRRDFEPYYPLDRFRTYSDFTSQPGDILKNEPRTLITRISLGTETSTAPKRAFAVKLYRYSRKSQLRTWYRQSTTHAEFSASCHLVALGIPTVTPVACGLQRSWLGSVQSCFLVTAFADGFVSLRDWLTAHPSLSQHEAQSLTALARALGGAVQKMHVHRLFVSRLSAKNILVRLAPGGEFEWLFIDHPFAGFHKRASTARFMQMYDLGRFKNSLLRFKQEGFFEEFLAAYLPDPLGQSEETLRKGIAYGVSIRHNRKPLLRAMRGIRNIVQPGHADKLDQLSEK